MATLVLLRAGQNQWNLERRFTGWYDADISTAGAKQATQAGVALGAEGLLPDVVHTSLQTRAIKTANLVLRELNRLWIPVRRHWRLNERHYGVLTGLNMDQAAQTYGEEKLDLWSRSYDAPPPEMPADHPNRPETDPRYADVPPEVLPSTECLKDVVDRTRPYWFDAIVPDLAVHRTVLIAAHGDSLRALVKHLSCPGSDDIAELSIPTGLPLVYQIGSDGRAVSAAPIEDRALR